jgi:hypothetical protein
MSQNIVIDRATVASILTAHADNLRTRDFQLIPIPHRDELDAISVNCSVDHSELLVIGDYQDLNYLGDQLEELRSSYPDLDKILSFKPEHMVCAGGAVTASILQYEELVRGDADIFFYDRLTNEPAEGTVSFDTKEAEETIRMIFEWVQREKAGLWYGLRNQNVTTLWICPEIHRGEVAGMDGKTRTRFIMGEGAKYQFVHRVFPTKASVIGGFDISPCMFLYDGTEIFGLPISLFAIKTGYIIADLSRRSPSFEMRLKKYSKRYGFGIIIPCMSNSEIKDFVRTSPFEASSGRFGPAITVGGCLRIVVTNGGGSIDLAGRLYKQQFSDVSDYDAGQCDYSQLATINSIAALQGKACLLSWGGSSLVEIFASPVIPYLNENQLSEKFERINSRVYGRRPDFGAMCRWFGTERCYKKNTSLKKANYPDVCFDDTELPPPLDKKKHRRRKGENKNGALNAPQRYPTISYKAGLGQTDEDEIRSAFVGPEDEHNWRWPCLTQREIAIAKRVISFRCDAFQATMEDRWLTRVMVTWIGQNENPGRQFTASFNPITEVRDWYNPKMSRPMQIGIPHQIFKQLKLLQLYGSRPVAENWYAIRETEKVPPFGRDVLRLICRELWKLYAAEGHLILEMKQEPKVSTRQIYYEKVPVATDRELNLEIVENCAAELFGSGEEQLLAKKILEHVDDVENFSMWWDESTAEFLNRLWEQISRTIHDRELQERYERRIADGEAARQRYLDEHAEEIAKTKAFNAKMLARIPKHLTESVHDPENPWMGMGSTRWMELCDEYGDKDDTTVVVPDEVHKAPPRLSQKEITFVTKVIQRQSERISLSMAATPIDQDVSELVEFLDNNETPPRIRPFGPTEMTPDQQQGTEDISQFLNQQHEERQRVKKQMNAVSVGGFPTMKVPYGPSSEAKITVYPNLIGDLEDSTEEESEVGSSDSCRVSLPTEESSIHQLESDKQRNLRIFDRLSEKQKAAITNPSQPWMGIGFDKWIDLERQFGSSDGEDEEWSGEELSDESEGESEEDNVEERAKKISLATLYQGMSPNRESYAEPEEDDSDAECLTDGVQICDYSKNLTEQDNVPGLEDNVEYQEIDFEPIGLVAKRRDGVHDLRQANDDSREIVRIADPKPASCGDMLANRYSQKGIIPDDIRKLMNDQKAKSDEEI